MSLILKFLSLVNGGEVPFSKIRKKVYFVLVQLRNTNQILVREATAEDIGWNSFARRWSSKV